MRKFTQLMLALALAFVVVGGAKSNRYIVYNNGTAGVNSWDRQAICKFNTSLTIGQQYIIKAKIKVEDADGETAIGFNIDDGVAYPNTKTNYLAAIVPTSEFVEYTWYYTPNDFVPVQMIFNTGLYGGKIYIDDVSCKPNGGSTEYIDNGDFNLPDISNWTNNYQGPKYTIDSDFPNADFVMVYNNGTAGANGWDKQAIVKLNTALEDGEQYIVKVKIKVGTATEEQIQLVPDGVAAQYLGLINPTTEFKEYQWWFNSSGAQTELHFFTGKIGGFVYFDDISCKKNGSSTELIDNGNFNSIDISNWSNNWNGPSYTRWDYEVPVTVGAAGFTTFSTNKAINVDGVVTAYTAKYDGTKIALTPVTEIPANSGIIIEAAADNYLVHAINSADELTGNELLVSDGTVEGNGNIYVLANKTDGVGFYKLNDGQKVPAGKAYLVIAAAAPEFVGFGDTTGIEATLNEGVQMTDGVIFDLSGRRVANPTKGIYIKNGKKFIVK